MLSTELECGHAFERQMAWAYGSCPGVMARFSVSNLVVGTPAATVGRAARGPGWCYARWDWTLHRSGGVPAAYSSVVDFRIGFAAFRVLNSKGPVVNSYSGGPPGPCFQCGGIWKNTILGHRLMSDNGAVVAEFGDHSSNLNGSTASAPSN